MGKINIGPSQQATIIHQPGLPIDEILNTGLVVPETIYIPEIKEVIVEKEVEVIKYVPEYITIEKIVEVVKEVKVPEYITVEKIIEIPRIQIVEKPYEVIKEVINISKVMEEKNSHDITKNKLKRSHIVICGLIVLNLLTAVLHG